MAKFMLLCRNPAEPPPPPSPEEMQTLQTQWYAWMQKYATSIVGGDGLKPNGKNIRANGVVTDGPYIEAKEVIISFTIIQADDIEGALAIARECPITSNGPFIEIREFAGYS